MLRLWHLPLLGALPALVVGLLVGRYVVPHNGPETAFYQHLNDAFEARQGSEAAQRRIAERYGATTTSEAPAPAPEDDAAAAQAKVRAAVPALEAYNADHAGRGYTGVTLQKLQTSYDAGIDGVDVERADSATYCVQSTVGTSTYHKEGPAGEIVPGPCAVR